MSLSFSYLNTIFIPPQNPSSPDPLLIALHGLGDSANSYRPLPSLLELPNIACLLVNAPDPYLTGYSWFDMEGNESGLLRSRKLLFRLLDDLHPQWGTIGVLGFSQGALLSLDIALHYPHKLAAIVAISGFAYLPKDLKISNSAKEKPVFASHGHRDPILPIHTTRAQIQELQNKGMNIRWEEYDKDHSIAPQEAKDIGSFLKEHFCKKNGTP